MILHLDNGWGLPLCGLRGLRRPLAVTKIESIVDCLKCQKSMRRQKEEDEVEPFEWENGLRVRMPAGKKEFGVGVVYRVCKRTVYVKWANGDKGSWRKARLEVVR